MRELPYWWACRDPPVWMNFLHNSLCRCSAISPNCLTTWPRWNSRLTQSKSRPKLAWECTVKRKNMSASVNHVTVVGRWDEAALLPVIRIRLRLVLLSPSVLVALGTPVMVQGPHCAMYCTPQNTKMIPAPKTLQFKHQARDNRWKQPGEYKKTMRQPAWSRPQ